MNDKAELWKCSGQRRIEDKFTFVDARIASFAAYFLTEIIAENRIAIGRNGGDGLHAYMT